MRTRKLISKETNAVAHNYRGRTGEIWWREYSTRLHFGKDLVPGGVTTSGGIIGATVDCAAGKSTVIYTATLDTVRVIRLSVSAQGYETGVTDYQDVQGCEIVAVKNQRTQTGEATVYGITYTSANPLVSFDADWVNGFLVVTATPTGLTNPVTVNSVAFEIDAGN
jgi:hypothetical protein